MKRAFLAVIMAGSSMAMFAQTTPTTNPTTSPTTSPTTNQSTTTNSTTNSTTDPMNTVTNSQMNSNGTYNAMINPSTSWEPGTSPSWGWNGYGIWNNSGNLNSNSNLNGSYNGSTTLNNNTMNNGTNVNGDLSSTGSYNAYGTTVAGLPMNVQMRFNQDFPSGMNNTYSWSQYGDWFHTQYRNAGRSMHYFYNTRGDGYALALPVIQTYVPEDIIDKALNKYGASLYSIGMVSGVDTGNVYQLGIIQNGQMHSEYLNDNGVTVANVWRTEENMGTAGSLNSTDANAAMGSQDNMNSSSSMSSSDMNSSMSTDTKTKSKTKIKNADGTETKIKVKDGKTKIKTSGTPSDL
ncbi:MAG: hypothetical protein EON98_02490 [Chitinophagaceae bacterium]|nr:MAG: hypothetical protein EON98_02490 [Chitinophagaceae bacterium]